MYLALSMGPSVIENTSMLKINDIDTVSELNLKLEGL